MCAVSTTAHTISNLYEYSTNSTINAEIIPIIPSFLIDNEKRQIASFEQYLTDNSTQNGVNS